MRWPTQVLLAGCLLVLPAPPAAAQSPIQVQQKTIQELLDLQAAGMPDDILIGLFESNGTVFSLSADDLIYLRWYGLSDRVLLAMLNTRRPEPQPVVQPAPSDVQATDVRRDPVVVQVEQQVNQTVEVQADRTPRPRVVHVPVVVPVPVPRVEPRPEPEPVYWGFGGKRRPDSWDPAPKRGDVKPGTPKTGPGGRTGGGGGGGR